MNPIWSKKFPKVCCARRADDVIAKPVQWLDERREHVYLVVDDRRCQDAPVWFDDINPNPQSKPWRVKWTSQS